MPKKSRLFLSLLSPAILFPITLSGMFLGAVAPTQATTIAAAASLCLTASTNALHAAAEAQLSRDIAAYKNDAKAANAVEVYRESLTLAWEAMEQPYCGHGSPGAAAAKKSYSKTVDRARAAFQKNVKTGASPTPLVQQEPTNTNYPTTTAALLSEKQVAAIAKTPLAPPSTPPQQTSTRHSTASAANVTTHVTVHLDTGLERGMQSSSVRELQQRLYTYFHMTNTPTTYFGSTTEDLLIKFQLSKRLIASRTSPGAGIVGPKTAAALNAL